VRHTPSKSGDFVVVSTVGGVRIARMPYALPVLPSSAVSYVNSFVADLRSARKRIEFTVHARDAGRFWHIYHYLRFLCC
jgi:hypothetical protein